MVVGAALLIALAQAAWNLVAAVRFFAAGGVATAGWWFLQAGLAATLAAIAVGFLRLGRRRLQGPASSSGAHDAPSVAADEEPLPVPVPSAEDVAQRETPIRACPRCGYLGIRAAEVGDGIWPGGGELIDRVCPRCNFRGQPLMFHERDDYLAFLQELARTREPAESTPSD